MIEEGIKTHYFPITEHIRIPSPSSSSSQWKRDSHKAIVSAKSSLSNAIEKKQRGDHLSLLQSTGQNQPYFSPYHSVYLAPNEDSNALLRKITTLATLGRVSSEEVSLEQPESNNRQRHRRSNDGCIPPTSSFENGWKVIPGDKVQLYINYSEAVALYIDVDFKCNRRFDRHKYSLNLSATNSVMWHSLCISVSPSLRYPTSIDWKISLSGDASYTTPFITLNSCYKVHRTLVAVERSALWHAEPQEDSTCCSTFSAVPTEEAETITVTSTSTVLQPTYKTITTTLVWVSTLTHVSTTNGSVTKTVSVTVMTPILGVKNITTDSTAPAGNSTAASSLQLLWLLLLLVVVAVIVVAVVVSKRRAKAPAPSRRVASFRRESINSLYGATPETRKTSINSLYGTNIGISDTRGPGSSHTNDAQQNDSQLVAGGRNKVGIGSWVDPKEGNAYYEVDPFNCEPLSSNIYQNPC
ncbi:hypothetical protein FHG87_007936 [Trinorchestia longiramus]|nr:hypothetical protein FHG87_007936 [Trinorchestia longiramus]